MKITKILLYLVLALTVSSFSVVMAQSYNYEEMEMDEYNALLQEWQNRLDAAQKGIAEEDAKITEAQSQLDETQALVDAV